MPAATVALSYTPIILWVAVGVGLLATYRRATSTTVFRLAAVFLATWALLATTGLVWVLGHGGPSALVPLVTAPLSLFSTATAQIWIEGALGAFVVFFAAFLLNQVVGRGFLAILRPEPLRWPERLAIPLAPTSLFRFASRRPEAFTFTLLERGGPRLLRRRDIILVADGLLRELSLEEWEAVVAHELGHLSELDGRYLTFFRTLARMMRWDPVLAYLADALTRREEFRADLDAVALTARPRALARALYKATVRAGAPTAHGTALLGVGAVSYTHLTLPTTERV